MGVFNNKNAGGSGGGGGLTAPVVWSNMAALTASKVMVTDGSGVATVASFGASDVVTLTGTQNLTNKTLTSSTNVLGGVTMTLGSDADGDTYVRNSGVLTRIAKGTSGHYFIQGATIPAWGALTLTIGTTATSGGTSTNFLHHTSGVVGSTSGFTYTAPAGTPTVTLTSGTFSVTGISNNTPISSTSVSTSSGGAAIAATHTAAGNTASRGAINATTTNTGTSGVTVLGSQLSNTTTVPTFGAIRSSSATAASVSTIKIEGISTGTPAAGFGSHVHFTLQSSTTADQDAAKIVVAWSTATNASRTSQIEFHLVQAAGAIANAMTVSTNFVDLVSSSSEIRIGGTKVVDARITGWGAITGTPSRTGFTMRGTVDMNATYDETQQQAMSDALTSLESMVMQIFTDLQTHGLIGT